MNPNFDARRGRRLELACGWMLALGCVMVAADVWAQGPAAVKKTAPPATKGAKPPATPAPPPVSEPDTGLPAGYKAPADVPELMLLDLPLSSEEELTRFEKKELKAYKSALRGREGLGNDKKDLIRRGLKYQLHLMTLKDNQRNLAKLRNDLVYQQLRSAGELLGKPEEIREFRRFVLTELLKLAEPLLENNQLVRLHVAILLGELDLTETDTNKGLTYEAFAPAAELAAKVLADPKQPIEVKIAAAHSATRALKYGQPSVEIRHKVARAAVGELANNKTFYWYQMRLAECLSVIDAPLDLQTRKPFIVQALLGALNDKERHWHVRAEAARALGRVTLDPQVDISGLVRDVTRLAHELAKAWQAKPGDLQLEHALFRVYLAFKAYDGNDKDAARRNRGGLLNNPSAAAAAQEPYTLIVPLVNAAINNQQITADQVQNVEKWLDKSKPAAANTASQQKQLSESPSAPVSNGGNR